MTTPIGRGFLCHTKHAILAQVLLTFRDENLGARALHIVYLEAFQINDGMHVQFLLADVLTRIGWCDGHLNKAGRTSVSEPRYQREFGRSASTLSVGLSNAGSGFALSLLMLGPALAKTAPRS